MKWKLQQFSEAEVLFTSDTHFCHKNIIRICNRPFKDVEDMNDQLVENWNKVVHKDSHVFHLGDFALGGVTAWNSILDRLNGNIHLIMGNHDYQNARAIPVDRFASIDDMLQIQIKEDEQFLTLCHYPFLTWGGYEKGVWNLYGHYHTQPGHILQGTSCKQYDVGVEQNNYTPLTYQQVKQIINEQISRFTAESK